MESQKNQDIWSAVDEYIVNTLVPNDSVLEATLKRSFAANLPPHQVSANQGKFLQILAEMQAARNILEIGTLGGYSTIWLARSLPKGGRLVTLEINSDYAEIARVNITDAGLSDVVEIRVGPALEELPKIAAQNHGPFDLTFIDADKQSNPEYFQWALKLSRPGSVIIIDNVVRDGAVINANSEDPRVQGVRRLNGLMAIEKRISATAIQTVGSKGYDGFAVARVIEG